MATITRAELISKLEQLDSRERVEAALTDLGWNEKQVFGGTEVITLGTVMVEAAQAELARSADPADQAKAEALQPYIDTMRAQVLPHLDAER